MSRGRNRPSHQMTVDTSAHPLHIVRALRHDAASKAGVIINVLAERWRPLGLLLLHAIL